MKPTLLAPMPASFFGIAVGPLALAAAWRVAVPLWHLPAIVADALTVGSLLVWVAILAGYAHTWWRHPAAARAELEHPVLSAYISLGPVSSMLAANALQAVSRPLAVAVFVVAALAGLGIGAHQYARVWKGHLSAAQVTPVAYIPGVAANLVAGAVAANLGWHGLGGLFFGAGVLSWLAIESIMLHRVTAHPELDPVLRPGLGIQLAPPVVAGGAYLSLTTGAPDVIALALLGYGLYQLATMGRLLPWIVRQPFTPAYWAFSFGIAALPTMAMRMVARGAEGSVEWIAIASFVFANVAIGLFIVRTIGLWINGRLLPVVAPRRVAAH
ncbi:tellurite resistance protein [Pararobbsia alpina]|uniref:dicarboxylate transporter/tellurite-resistance protein TehA n=1 Tax=Pararobbsia alpina TaxID=621374 RepID=UPI0039A4CA22